MHIPQSYITIVGGLTSPIVTDPDRPAYTRARNRMTSFRDDGTITEAEHEFIADFCDAYDPDDYTVPTPEGQSAYSYSTLATKANICLTAAKRMDTSLAEADADSINGYLSVLRSGNHPDVKDGGLTQNTVRSQAGSLRKLVEYHGTAEKTNIVMPDRIKTSVDEADMFSTEDITALREATSNARNLALVDMFIYTGQRVNAIRTLRCKDIDVDDGSFRLNPETAGLKGAEGKRPLLGAKGSIRRWLNRHPCDDPEAAVFTCLPSAARGTMGEPITHTSIRTVLKNIGEDAGVDKPVNPHNFRHNFVTIAKRNYGLSDSEIKYLIGHAPDSDVMNTTYSHLTDEEKLQNVGEKAGFREPEDDSPLSPPACPTCDEALPDDARACQNCGEVFTPDAKAAEDRIGDMLYKGRAEDDGEHADIIDALREELRENPEMKQKVLAELLSEE